MSVEGLCEVCESGTVEDGCERCGRLVCAEHYDEPTGFCTACVSAAGRRPDEHDGGRDEHPDGVDEYRF
jgi:hypothetical protein